MQAGKGAMESVKETASNVAASARAGMDKSKATVQEKVDKMTAHSPAEKELAEERKREKIREAEIAKREAKQQNAAARDQKVSAGTGGHVADPGDYSVGGAPVVVASHPTGGHAVGGLAETHPIARETGTERASAAHNPYVGSTEPGPHGTGGRYV